MKKSFFSAYGKRALAFVLLLLMMIPLTACGGDGNEGGTEQGFDYENCNFSEYLTLDLAAYEGTEISVPLAKTVTKEEEEKALNELLRYYGTEIDVVDRAAVEGDTLKIYYRGVLVAEDGTEKAFDGGTAMSFGKPSKLTLGSGQFIPGFEEGLVGVVPQNTYKFVTDESLALQKDSVLHVTCKGTYEGMSEPLNKEDQLLDFSACAYGEAFVTAMLGAKAGETRTFTAAYDANGDKTAEDVEFTVTVKDVLSLNACTVTATFPTPYHSAELEGKTAKFYVWVESIIDIEPAELTDAFLKDKLKYTTDETDIMAAFRAEFLADLQSARDADVKNATLSKIWDKLIASAKFSKLPEGEVDAIVKSMREEAEYYLSYYQNYGYSFANLADFVIQYYGLTDKKADDFDVDAYFEEQADKSVRQYTLQWYLINTYALTVDDEKLAKAEADFYEDQAASSSSSGQSMTATQIKEQYAKEYGEDYVKDYIRESLLVEALSNKMLEKVQIKYEK